jgi:muramidase (phage lysozyme)
MEPLTDEEREAKIATLEAEQENKEAENKEQKEAEKSEHEDKYFVVNGGTCVCNKAQDVNKEAEIVVSKNSKLIINDDAKKFAATEEDIKMKPASSTFGKCILQPTSSDYLACMPAFLPKWEKAYNKKTVDGKKILTELSTLQCTIGGKIEIKKHGQENSVVKEHAENTNVAEQALINPAVSMPVLEIKYPSVSSIVLKEITGRARFGEIKSEGSGVEKIKIRLNEELTFNANLNKGNEKLTSWVIYEMKTGKVAAKFITLEQKGTSFQNTFSTLGTYRVEGYGKPKTPTYNDGKNDKNYTDCSIDVEVIVNKLDGNVLLPKEASNFTRVKGKENTLRQGTQATFEAKFLLDPNKEELGNLQIYATDASGNVVASGTQSGNTFTFTPTNSKAKYTILAKYTNLEGQVESQTFSATTESIYVNSISHADEVIRPETPMTFKVVNTQFKTTGGLTNEEAVTVKWNLNGQLVGSGSCVEIPGVYFLKEGKYVVEAYVNTANANVTSGSNKDNEKDDWHFEVKKNDVLRFGYIGGVPKVGKTTQLKADKFIMPPIAGEKVVWNVFGKILENTSYNNPVIDITPGYARKENVTCKINHQKGVSQSIEIVEAEILNAYFTDSNGIKINNASWEQTVYIYIDAKHLSGEEINIKVYDQDYFDGNDHVGSVNTKSYNGKPLEFKLDKTVKDKTGSNGKLYFKVSAPHLTLKNSETRFPSEKLTVEDAISFENPIIGEENGLKKHYLVDYDDISWFYVNTTGIKDTTKLKIGVWQYNKEKELVHILALKHTLDKDGVLKAKIEWNKIQKIKTSRIVYIRVKDENDKILCDSVSKMNEAALTLQFTPTAVKMVENKAAMVVGTQDLGKKANDDKVCECEAKVRAFMRMIRIGEGTGELDKRGNIKDPQIGYATAFGGNKITDLSTHPNKVYKGSSAAGAYQIMGYTYAWLGGSKLEWTGKYFKILDVYEPYHDYRKSYNITDFQPESQDRLCICLMKDKKGMVELIIDGEIEAAIRKYGSSIWASLPFKGDNSKYEFNGKAQPATPMKECLLHYEAFLKDELTNKSNLHLKKGFLKEFGYPCCNEKNIKAVEGKGWNVDIHLWSDRKEMGYGILVLKNDSNKEVWRTIVRAQGYSSKIGGVRTEQFADTPTGVYKFEKWRNDGSSTIYGANHRLDMTYVSGEAKSVGREEIQIHGGRQADDSNPYLWNTGGCLRVFDDAISTLKKIVEILESKLNKIDDHIINVNHTLKYDKSTKKYFTPDDYLKILKNPKDEGVLKKGITNKKYYKNESNYYTDNLTD